MRNRYDAVVIGSGHNGLVAAACLARAGKSVLVLERNATLGGATVSRRIFPAYDARLSRYSYLVSLFPKQLVRELKLDFQTQRRSTASFTPWTDASGQARGLLISNKHPDRSRHSMLQLTGSHNAWNRYRHLLHLQQTIAEIAWPSLVQPLQSRTCFTSQLKTAMQREAWTSFIDRPLGEVIERCADHDVLRGLLMTDAKIGVLTHPHDPTLLQNRCFLYHIIGNGTGEWQVPIGGMQSLVDALISCCRQHDVAFRTHAEAVAIDRDNCLHSIEFIQDQVLHTVDATHVLLNAGPRTSARLLGETWTPLTSDEGSVIKMNLLLSRLPRLRTTDATAEEAFTGSLHIDEEYSRMISSWRSAEAGELPVPAPGEVYCHSLTDPSILSPELRDRGFQTLTLFGLDMPYRLFTVDHNARAERVRQLYLEGLDRICDEPFLDCVTRDPQGEPCIEIRTPQDLERELDLDLGNIFHNTLSWFFTDDSEEIGRWGVETPYPRIYRAGSSALRGGGVSGIPGWNCAQCILGN